MSAVGVFGKELKELKMKIVARHADGTKSEWQMETNDHTDAIETVSNVIMAETGALPKSSPCID